MKRDQRAKMANRNMANWRGFECVTYVLKGEDLHPVKVRICSAGLIGLPVFIRESHEHILHSEEFFQTWLHTQGKGGGARQN